MGKINQIEAEIKTIKTAEEKKRAGGGERAELRAIRKRLKRLQRKRRGMVTAAAKKTPPKVDAGESGAKA